MLKTLLSYGLGAVGLVMMLVALTTVVAATMDYAAGRYRVINLLRTAPNNAHHMLTSAPMTFFEPLAMVMKTLVMTRTSDAKTVQATSGPTYDGCVKGIEGKWAALMIKAKMGLGAVAGGLAVGLSKDEFPILLTIASAIAGIAFLWIYLKKVDIDRSMLRARAEILPEVEAAFIQGRYVLPPMPE